MARGLGRGIQKFGLAHVKFDRLFQQLKGDIQWALGWEQSWLEIQIWDSSPFRWLFKVKRLAWITTSVKGEKKKTAVSWSTAKAWKMER